MLNYLTSINIQVKESLYLKDPESSDLGKKIIKGCISLIHEIGFEQFTFRKLAKEIGSTEASIYRYFENKHKVLLYLTSWYWSWMEYRLAFITTNIDSAEERLIRAIDLITENDYDEEHFDHINVSKLYQLVIEESTKVYLTKEVDEENKDGAYLQYKLFVGRISAIIKEINPEYKYPNMLVSTMIEGAHLQKYYADHIPSLTNVVDGENSIHNFYIDIITKAVIANEK